MSHQAHPAFDSGDSFHSALGERDPREVLLGHFLIRDERHVASLIPDPGHESTTEPEQVLLGALLALPQPTPMVPLALVIDTTGRQVRGANLALDLQGMVITCSLNATGAPAGTDVVVFLLSVEALNRLRNDRLGSPDGVGSMSLDELAKVFTPRGLVAADETRVVLASVPTFRGVVDAAGHFSAKSTLKLDQAPKQLYVQVAVALLNVA